MKELSLFTIESPYRQPLAVKAWQFGDPGKRSLAVVGALRGNEIQQMFICARLVQTLKKLEADGLLSPECGILVVPCANRFSMNVGSRFWAADHTDINRMFPGYNLGETTQRIADRLFHSLQGYEYGIHLASFYLPGDYAPHVRVMHTGFEDLDSARDFALPHIILRDPQPYDTTTLNYNWQIWSTQAVSLYSSETDHIDALSAGAVLDAILRFLHRKGLSLYDVPDPGSVSSVVVEKEMKTVHSSFGGLFFRKASPGDSIAFGAPLAEILDPCTCEAEEQLLAPCSGRIFFAHKEGLIAGHEIAFRIIEE